MPSCCKLFGEQSGCCIGKPPGRAKAKSSSAKSLTNTGDSGATSALMDDETNTKPHEKGAKPGSKVASAMHSLKMEEAKAKWAS